MIPNISAVGTDWIMPRRRREKNGIIGMPGDITANILCICMVGLLLKNIIKRVYKVGWRGWPIQYVVQMFLATDGIVVL